MAEIRIYGASDDLIEIEGTFTEEFSFYPTGYDDKRFLAFSDGTLLRATYDNDGIWRLTRLASGSAAFEKVEGDVEKDTNDVVTLRGEIKWAVLGIQRAGLP